MLISWLFLILALECQNVNQIHVYYLSHMTASQAQHGLLVQYRLQGQTQLKSVSVTFLRILRIAAVSIFLC